VQQTLKHVGQQTGFYVAVAILVALAAFPFYWMLLTAFKTDSGLYNLQSNPLWFNAPPTLAHIDYLFVHTMFARWLVNSLVIGACVVAITLLTAVANNPCKKPRRCSNILVMHNPWHVGAPRQK